MKGKIGIEIDIMSLLEHGLACVNVSVDEIVVMDVNQQIGYCEAIFDTDSVRILGKFPTMC